MSLAPNPVPDLVPGVAPGVAPGESAVGEHGRLPLDLAAGPSRVGGVTENSTPIETTPQLNGGGGSYGLDDHIYQRLLRERIVFLGSEVRDQNANAILCAAAPALRRGPRG